MAESSESKDDGRGASPMPEGDRKPGENLFDPTPETEKKERDMTGQTDKSLKHMKQRLKEVPKESAGSEHDKEAYRDEQHAEESDEEDTIGNP